MVQTVGIVAPAADALIAPQVAMRFGLVLKIVLAKALSEPWLLAAGLAPT